MLLGFVLYTQTHALYKKSFSPYRSTATYVTRDRSNMIT